MAVTALAVTPARRAWLALLPLLALHVAVCALTQPGPVPVNDERSLLEGAERLLDGHYAVRGTGDDVAWLWHGPGLPLVLVPLVALRLPLDVIRMLLGPVLLFGAVVALHAALRRHVRGRVALGGAVALGLFGPAMQPLQTVHKEPLAMLLTAVAMLLVSRAVADRRPADVAGAGAALGALAMVRVEYGWLLLAVLAVALGVWLARRSATWTARTCATVLAVGLACCLPWLAYTADVSGRFPYWGNSGGESLYWMSPTGVPGQTGEFNGVRPVFERAELASVRPLFRRLDRLSPLQRDLELQRVAAANVRARPGWYARNLAANAVRLWFLVPTRPAPPAGAVAMYAVFNGGLLAALAWAAAVLVRRRRRLPAVALPFALFAAAGLGFHLLPSADPRMTLPLLPPLVWLVALAAAHRRAHRRERAGTPVRWACPRSSSATTRSRRDRQQRSRRSRVV